MTPAGRWFKCGNCGRTELIVLSDAAMRLTTLGMLRRAKDPEPAVVWELFVSSLKRVHCDGCGQSRLAPSDAPKTLDDEFAWPEAKPCEECGKPISAERLEILPATVRCTACQKKDDSGELAEVATDDDFCPRCGDLMKIKSAGSGITRYRSYCPTCRR